MSDSKTDEWRRMVTLLERMATERTGWRGFFSRWYYSHEALRNDAANLLRDMGYTQHILPYHTRILGDKGNWRKGHDSQD
jgi:outer membrane phospholipase A